MHIKFRGARALLYRSTWVPKGAEGNSHGFSRQSFVASVPVNATVVPEDLRSRISSEELAYIESKLIAAAREAMDAARRAEEYKRRDPVWRLEQAAQLIAEAADLSSAAVVPQGRVRAVSDALAGVKVVGGALRETQKGDPLAEALHALRAAARAVNEGQYGNAPQEGVRRSRVYAHWLEIAREVEGATEGGLLRALQRTGWVKAKGR